MRSLRRTSLAALILLAAAVGRASPDTSNPPTANMFWGALDKLGIVIRSLGNLGGGVERGEVWIVNLRTAERHHVGSSNDLAWPVLTPDDRTVFALRDGRLMRIGADGTPEAWGAGVGWRKLLAIAPDGAILGFISGRPRAQAAMLLPSGTLVTLPQPETEQERLNTSILLQEERDYADGRRLEVQRSERGGHGFDVYLLAAGRTQNLSDCGDNACGQPSLSADGAFVIYIQSAAN
jgi:hypothetical protein